MSSLKFAHYQFQAKRHGIILQAVKGRRCAYWSKGKSGAGTVYLFSDTDMIEYVNTLGASDGEK